MASCLIRQFLARSRSGFYITFFRERHKHAQLCACLVHRIHLAASDARRMGQIKILVGRLQRRRDGDDKWSRASLVHCLSSFSRIPQCQDFFLLIPVDLLASADRTESCRWPCKAPSRSNVQLSCEPLGFREMLISPISRRNIPAACLAHQLCDVHLRMNKTLPATLFHFLCATDRQLIVA